MTYSYDRLGRRSQIASGPNCCTTSAYNDAGQLLSETHGEGPLTGLSVTSAYDAALHRTGLSAHYSTTPILQQSMTYDAAGRLHTVTDLSAGQAGGPNTATYSYLANSPLVGQIVFAQNGQTRMTTTKQYDALNRLTQIASVPSASSAVSFAYQYNAANQRTHATLDDGSSWSYAYDDLGQVTSANHAAADGTPVPGEQFGYAFDDIGNRQETTETSRSVTSRPLQAAYAANNLNQYTARTVPDDADPTGLANPPEQFQYDADGNLIQDARWSYGWDAENRLVAMVSSGAPGLPAGQAGPKQLLQFDYDWQGRRIRKRVWNNPAGHGNPDVDQRFLYDGWNLIALLNSSLSIPSPGAWTSAARPKAPVELVDCSW